MLFLDGIHFNGLGALFGVITALYWIAFSIALDPVLRASAWRRA